MCFLLIGTREGLQSNTFSGYRSSVACQSLKQEQNLTVASPLLRLQVNNDQRSLC